VIITPQAARRRLTLKGTLKRRRLEIEFGREDLITHGCVDNALEDEDFHIHSKESSGSEFGPVC
jgi:hypothetical protein